MSVSKLFNEDSLAPISARLSAGQGDTPLQAARQGRLDRAKFPLSRANARVPPSAMPGNYGRSHNLPITFASIGNHPDSRLDSRAVGSWGRVPAQPWANGRSP